MGFFSKLWRGVKKTFKKIGKGIKKVFAKVGKWANKLGVVGQIAMMFIPFGQIFAPMLSSLSSSFLGILGKGLASANPLIKGASWLVNAAYKTGSAIYKGYKTVTGAVTKFVGETAGFVGNKLGLTNIEGAAGSFFGKGADSVLGRVGQETVKNWNGFKSAVGGIIEFNPTKTGLEYMERANLLKGEYRYQDDRLPKVPKAADIPVRDASFPSTVTDSSIYTGAPLTRASFTPLADPFATPETRGGIAGWGDIDPFSGEPIKRAGTETVIDSFTGEPYVKRASADSITLNNNNNGTDGVLNVDVKTDTVPKVDTVPDEKSLLGKVGDSMAQSAVEFPSNVLTNLATGAIQQEVFEPPTIEERARNALNPSFRSNSYDIGQVISSMAPLMTTPTNFYQNSEYNLLMANLMNTFGVSGGAFGNPYMNLSQPSGR